MPYPTLGAIPPVALGSQTTSFRPIGQGPYLTSNSTLHDTNGAVFDVLSAPFQDVDNPTNTDSPAILAAIQAAVCLGGGVVYLPYKPGGAPYILDQPITDYGADGITICGNGRATIVQPADSLQSTSEAFVNFSGRGSTLKDIYFNVPHNPQAGPAIDLIWLYGNLNNQTRNYRIQNIWVNDWNGYVCVYKPDTNGQYPFGVYIQDLFANNCSYGMWAQANPAVGNSGTTATHWINCLMSNVQVGDAFLFQNSIDHHLYSPSGNLINGNTNSFMHLIGGVRTLDVINYNGGSASGKSLFVEHDPTTGAVCRAVNFMGGAIQQSGVNAFLQDFQQIAFTGINFTDANSVGAHIQALTFPNAIATFTNCTFDRGNNYASAIADIVVSSQTPPISVLINGCAFDSGNFTPSHHQPLAISCPATNQVTMIGNNGKMGLYTATYDNAPTIYQYNAF